MRKIAQNLKRTDARRSDSSVTPALEVHRHRAWHPNLARPEVSHSTTARAVPDWSALATPDEPWTIINHNQYATEADADDEDISVALDPNLQQAGGQIHEAPPSVRYLD